MIDYGMFVWNCFWAFCWSVPYFWRTYQWSKQREEIEELQTEFSRLESERNELKAKVEELKADNDELDRHCDERIAELEVVEKELLGMRDKCEQLTLDLDHCRAALQAAEEALEAEKENAATYRASYDALKDALEDLNERM